MLIDYNILITYGGVAKKYEKGEIIFSEGTSSTIFYQIIEGKVKMFSANTDGKELTQGYFGVGESFGEPPIFIGKPYPSTAQACEPTVVVKIGREKLMDILKDYPETLERLLFAFAQRIYHKASSAQIWVCHSSEEKVLLFLNKLKEENEADKQQLMKIPYTRQQIGDSTGLRVETVIRVIKKLHKQGKVKIKNRKIYF